MTDKRITKLQYLIDNNHIFDFLPDEIEALKTALKVMQTATQSQEELDIQTFVEKEQETEAKRYYKAVKALGWFADEEQQQLKSFANLLFAECAKARVEGIQLGRKESKKNIDELVQQRDDELQRADSLTEQLAGFVSREMKYSEMIKELTQQRSEAWNSSEDRLKKFLDIQAELGDMKNKYALQAATDLQTEVLKQEAQTKLCELREAVKLFRLTFPHTCADLKTIDNAIEKSQLSSDSKTENKEDSKPFPPHGYF